MLLTRRHGPLSLLELTELSWLPFLQPTVRIEQLHRDDSLVIRAELPGVDPVKDISLTLQDGVLRLTCLRYEETRASRGAGHSEFRYGTLHRSVILPRGALEDTIEASYANGILEITMRLGEPHVSGRTIPIASPTKS